MTRIEEISLHPPLDAHRPYFDRANTHTGTELLKTMQFRNIGGIAVATARPFEGPDLNETLEQGDAPIVRFLPWGNNAVRGEFNQPVQTQMLADISGRPVIAMSSPSLGSTLDLSREDRGIVAGGDFSPVAREMLASLEELTDGKLARVALMGASQGATFGIATAAEALRRDQFDAIDGVLVFGLPNVKERSRLQLLQDFAKAGPAELHETLVRGGVPQLVTANYFSLQEPGKAVRFSIDTTIKAGRHPVLAYALAGGMGKVDDIWQRDIPTILEKGVPLTLVSEGKGSVMPTESLQERVAELQANRLRLGLNARQLGRLGLYSVKDGDHTLADYLPLVAGFMPRIQADRK